jgi:CubicO group peptidase (beta-lactamase class C family)
MPTYPTRSEIDDLVHDTIDDGGAGLALAVIQGGKVIHARGYGLADLDRETPITTATVFDLASVSKQFTAFAILLLVERGQIDLDEPIRSYLHQFEVKSKGRDITVRDLLLHTSGLADYTGDDWDGTDEEFQNLTCEGHVHWLNGTRPARAPGKRYEYNNSGYALLARIVEEVSGQPYSAFVRDHIFIPLRMDRTVAFDDLSLRIPGRAKGYKEGEHVEEPSVIQGDGNLFSCIDDLIRWDAALRSGALVGSARLEEAWTNGALDDGSPIDDGEGSGYGFGWCIEEEDEAVSHSGSWAGTSTSILRYLGADLSILALSSRAIADELFEDE